MFVRERILEKGDTGTKQVFSKMFKICLDQIPLHCRFSYYYSIIVKFLTFINPFGWFIGTPSRYRDS